MPFVGVYWTPGPWRLRSTLDAGGRAFERPVSITARAMRYDRRARGGCGFGRAPRARIPHPQPGIVDTTDRRAAAGVAHFRGIQRAHQRRWQVAGVPSKPVVDTLAQGRRRHEV